MALAIIAASLASVALLLHHPKVKRAVGPAIGPLKALGDPFSSLGPNTGALAVSSGSTIPAYYNRQQITLSIDTASTAEVYGLCGSGTPSSTNFHFALTATQPPFSTAYSGPIQLVSSTGTIHVGVLEQ